MELLLRGISALLAHFIISTMGNNEICHYFTLWGSWWSTTGLNENINRIIGLINCLLFTKNSVTSYLLALDCVNTTFRELFQLCSAQSRISPALWTCNFSHLHKGHKSDLILEHDHNVGWLKMGADGCGPFPAHLGDVAQNKGPSWDSTTVTLSI